MQSGNGTYNPSPLRQISHLPVTLSINLEQSKLKGNAMETTINWLTRATDYVLGRNTLIGVASFMLLVISGYATWHGMRDFIVGVSSAQTSPGGAMSIPNDVLVILVVVALTILMWLMLRETFGAQRQWRERLVTFHCFLAMWSIGFGYGFW